MDNGTRYQQNPEKIKKYSYDDRKMTSSTRYGVKYNSMIS